MRMKNRRCVNVFHFNSVPSRDSKRVDSIDDTRQFTPEYAQANLNQSEFFEETLSATKALSGVSVKGK